jgi:Ca-activated chloride channel family protein
MKNHIRAALLVATIAAAAAALNAQQSGAERQNEGGDSFRFKSGVELVNVNATVSDSNGRFVTGLSQDDFVVYEDDQQQAVSHFNAERVPVSLGIVLDTSGSMAGDKIDAARGALDRFLYDLLGREDEIFVYRFSNYPVLIQGWTRDRARLSGAVGRITPNGGTAMYDAVAEAVPLAAHGANLKKALLLISDGNDTSSQTDVREVKQLIRETELLVYAIGIDGDGDNVRRNPQQPTRIPRPRNPTPVPFPFPRRPTFPQQVLPQIFGPGRVPIDDERVNAGALRAMTDDSGGRTEIIRDPRDLDPATAGIADELSRQYYLGYTSTGKKDGRWHSIRVEIKNHRNYQVRARRGYVAN